MEEIRDNLITRIAEAEREGRLGEVEGVCIAESAKNLRNLRLHLGRQGHDDRDVTDRLGAAGDFGAGRLPVRQVRCGQAFDQSVLA
ncbi:hypothetical protein [Streptomyces mirabilis]|uniref:hypothetical protein n=1 Tax=Streptomyces mirabilis TaxID=68239 RepID=UPI003668284D